MLLCHCACPWVQKLSLLDSVVVAGVGLPDIFFPSLCPRVFWASPTLRDDQQV